MSYGLKEIIRDLTGVVDHYEHEADRVREATELVARLVADPSWLPAERRQPSAQSYARHSLYIDPLDRFEILALVWNPGQRTPIHDHDTAWGVEGVMAGRIKATNYLQVDSSDAGVRLHRLGEVQLDAGETGELLPPADCHILETGTDGLTITIHVYGKQLRQFKIFDPTERPGLYQIRMHEVSYS